MDELEVPPPSWVESTNMFLPILGEEVFSPFNLLLSSPSPFQIPEVSFHDEGFGSGIGVGRKGFVDPSL